MLKTISMQDGHCSPNKTISAIASVGEVSLMTGGIVHPLIEDMFGLIL
ncbi:MAG: hypothetical protein ACUBOA_10995 [Candidatus Loosdrechtia sp.]|nr:MAG: hypothetical protein QY305_08000 [Candidatus Jettenia sp. AMX2]